MNVHALRKGIMRLELFEWLGLCASIAAAFVFFIEADKLDTYAHKPGYHFGIVTMVTGIYAHFLPYAIVVGTALFFLMTRLAKMRVRDFIQKWQFALRIFIAYCLLLIVFRIVNFYVPVLHPGIDDTMIQHADKLIFGNEVSYLLLPVVSHWLTNICTGAYVSWFWLLFATIVVLLARSRQAASEYLLATLIAFYIGYVFYIIFPVIGPGYTLHYPVTLGDIAPTYTLERAFIARDCFPSLHTATSVLMVLFVARHQRKWLWFYAPMALLIIFATLYLRIHYGVDDLAGVVLALLVYRGSLRAVSWWEKKRAEISEDETQAEMRSTISQ